MPILLEIRGGARFLELGGPSIEALQALRRGTVGAKGAEGEGSKGGGSAPPQKSFQFSASE